MAGMVNAMVSLSGSVDFDSTSTDINGIATLSLPEDHYEVEVTHFSFRDGEEIWTQKYEIVEGQTEATFTWIDDTVIYKVKVVDADGKPVANVRVDIYIENMDGTIPTVRTDTNGEATFRVRERRYIIWVYGDFDADGSYISYGTFEFPEGETEVVIVIGEPERIEMT